MISCDGYTKWERPVIDTNIIGLAPELREPVDGLKPLKSNSCLYSSTPTSSATSGEGRLGRCHDLRCCAPTRKVFFLPRFLVARLENTLHLRSTLLLPCIRPDDRLSSRAFREDGVQWSCAREPQLLIKVSFRFTLR